MATAIYIPNGVTEKDSNTIKKALSTLDDAEIKKINEFWAEYDKDKNGCINKNELTKKKSDLDDLDEDLTSVNAALKLMKTCDEDGDERLTYAEYINGVYNLAIPEVFDKTAFLRKIFFDADKKENEGDGNGVQTVQEVLRLTQRPENKHLKSEMKTFQALYKAASHHHSEAGLTWNQLCPGLEPELYKVFVPNPGHKLKSEVFTLEELRAKYTELKLSDAKFERLEANLAQAEKPEHKEIIAKGAIDWDTFAFYV